MVRTIAHSRPTGVFFVPVAAVRLLRRFRTLLHSGSQALALLAGDCDARVALGTDSGHEGREHEFEFAQISPHPNCFTLPVDFELLRSCNYVTSALTLALPCLALGAALSL